MFPIAQHVIMSIICSRRKQCHGEHPVSALGSGLMIMPSEHAPGSEEAGSKATRVFKA